MSESQYVTAIIKAISDIGGKAVKFVETEYSEKGTPDIIGSYKGRCFVIEAKVEHNKTSHIQDQRAKEWVNAGALYLDANYNNWKPKDVAARINEFATKHFMATPD